LTNTVRWGDFEHFNIFHKKIYVLNYRCTNYLNFIRGILIPQKKVTFGVVNSELKGLGKVRLLNARGWVSVSGVNFDLILVPNLILCYYENI